MRVYIYLLLFLFGIFCGLLGAMFLWGQSEGDRLAEEARRWAKQGAEETAKVSREVERLREKIEDLDAEAPSANSGEEKAGAKPKPNRQVKTAKETVTPDTHPPEYNPEKGKKKKLSSPDKLQEFLTGKSGKDSKKGPSSSKDEVPIPLGPPPDIHFEEVRYDFGEIIQGDKDKIERIYKYKNLGKGILQIGQIKTSCGCAAVHLTKNTIPPQGEGEIKIIFKAKGRTGRQNKKFYVYTNDPDESRVILYLSGLIQSVFDVKPFHLFFEDQDKKKGTTKTVTITSALGKPFRIDKIECSTAGRFEITSRKIEKEKPAYEVQVKLLEDAFTGKIRDTLKIHTDNKRIPVIYINIYGKLWGDIEVIPEYLAFGALEPGGEARKACTIFTKERNDLKVEDVENDLDYIHTEITEIEKGKKYQITVTVDTKAVPEDKPYFRDHIRIETNSKAQPRFEIRVFGFVVKKK